jgi:hypothetical protein
MKSKQRTARSENWAFIHSFIHWCWELWFYFFQSSYIQYFVCLILCRLMFNHIVALVERKLSYFIPHKFGLHILLNIKQHSLQFLKKFIPNLIPSNICIPTFCRCIDKVQAHFTWMCSQLNEKCNWSRSMYIDEISSIVICFIW